MVLQAITNAAVLVGALAFVAVVANWIAVAGRIKPLEYISKPTATVAIGALAVNTAPAGLRVLVIAAFSLCLVGDVLLMMPKDRFVGGLTAFLLGHAAFIGVFAQIGWGEPPPLAYVTIGLTAAAVAIVTARIVPRAHRIDARLSWAVGAYILTIFSMFVAAVATGRPMLGAGAFVFMSSDALIGFRRFSRLTESANVAIMILYHTALALLAFGIAG